MTATRLAALVADLRQRAETMDRFGYHASALALRERLMRLTGGVL